MLEATLQGQRERPSAVVYRQIIDAAKRRKVAMGLADWQLSDLSGVQDGYVGKLFAPDAPSGRQAGWDTIQDVLDALWPDGFLVTISAAGPRLPRGAAPGRCLHRYRNGNHWRRDRAPRPVTYLTNPAAMDPAMDEFVLRRDALMIAQEAGGSPGDVIARAEAYAAYLRGGPPAASTAPALPVPANDAPAAAA